MKIKRSYSIASKIAAIILIIVGIICANISRNESNINGIKIDIDYNNRDTLVTANNIENKLRTEITNIELLTVKEIDKKKIEEIVNSNPYISNSDVSVSIKGTIQIQAEQRTPIVRVVQNSKHFYIDNNGYYMPTSNIGSQNVILASGYIKGDINKKISLINDTNDMINNDIYKIYKLTSYLLDDDVLKHMFDHIYISQTGDIELVPKVGNHIVVLGSMDNLDEKFENLLAVYKEGFANSSWDRYVKLNLKYKNQVVCTKK